MEMNNSVARVFKNLYLSSLGLSTIGLTGCNNVAEKTDLPDIIIVMADDLGWADLPCYGNTLHEAENLTKLASEGLRFTNAYSAAPVSSPTRASLMTGITPARLHHTTWMEASSRPEWLQNDQLLPPITNGNLSLEYVTLAEVLKEKGYNTVHIGKWHLGNYEHFPQNQGFDICFGTTDKGCPADFFYPYRGVFANEFRFIPDIEISAEGNYFEDREGEYLTDRLTDQAVKIIKQAKGKPLFLNLNYYSVHTPIQAKPEHEKYFQTKITPETLNQNAAYAGMIFSLDENFGRVIKALKETGKYENSLILFLSDNGGYTRKWADLAVTTNQPLRSGKGSLYEGGIRVPMLMKMPGADYKGKQTDLPVSTQDIYPSIAEYLNIEPDTKTKELMEGKSFLPVVKNPDLKPEERTLCWHFPHRYSDITGPVSAVRHGDWKLLKFYETNSIELYDLHNDIGEKHNLAESEKELADKLLDMLDQWLKNVNAQFPEPNPNYKP